MNTENDKNHAVAPSDLTDGFAAMKRDAERYRWLVETMGLRLKPSGSCECCKTVEETNAAIDAAMVANAKVSGAGTASAGLPGYAQANDGERK